MLKLKNLEQQIKKYVGKNFQAGDEFVLEDSVKAIIKCREILAKIEEEGDLIILPNKIKTKNPLYEVLKYWNARKVESLTALGLTPYARKRLSGTAEADNSEATTGRKPNHKKTTREIQDEESEEFC